MRLEPLQLRSNFRSDAGLVDWFNASFEAAFPANSDTRRGQVSFTRASATRAAPGDEPAVELHGFHGPDAAAAETEFVCTRIGAALDRQSVESVAILGRSRAILNPLLAALRRQGIAFSTQDMETLASAPEVIDLVSLCRALLNPADRVAWLAVLRAPWCGLSLEDLHRLARPNGVPSNGMPSNGVPSHESLPGLIESPSVPAGLSEDGRRRLAVVRDAIRLAQQTRDRRGLRNWLEQVWLRLGGAAALVAAGAEEAVEAFFRLIEEADLAFGCLRLSWLEEKLAATPIDRQDPRGRIQVMTLHKAKGLEFDLVFLPFLERTVRQDSRPLLLWDDDTGTTGQRRFLLAADDRQKPPAPTLYNYLERERKLKARLETARLLYVGATRAARQLVLSASIAPDASGSDWRAPPVDSLLYPIRSTFHEQMSVHTGTGHQSDPVAAGPPRLKRVAHPTIPEEPSKAASETRGAGLQPATRERRMQRHVHAVVCQALADVTRLDRVPQRTPAAVELQYTVALRQIGLAGEALRQAQREVGQAVGRALTSRDGRWLLSERHNDGRDQWSLTSDESTAGYRQLQIDRSFIDVESGERWLVLYMNDTAGEEVGADRSNSAIVEACQESLRAARDAVAAAFPEPLRCAVYLTGHGKLVELEKLRLPARGSGATE